MCGNDVPRRNKSFCSATCRNKWLAIQRDQNGENNPNWKGGKKIDSTGYILVKNPESSRTDGYVQEHRLIAEACLSRKLTDDEDVHHIDGDKTNNNIENLQVIKRSEHMRLHAKEKTSQRRRDALGRYA